MHLFEKMEWHCAFVGLSPFLVIIPLGIYLIAVPTAVNDENFMRIFLCMMCLAIGIMLGSIAVWMGFYRYAGYKELERIRARLWKKT